MKIIGNIIWWIFGGLEAAIGYFTGSLALAVTIIGIPVAFLGASSISRWQVSHLHLLARR